MSTVTSRDGTRIAFDTRGAGPAVILVDGALGYRSFGSSGRLADLLAPTLRVTAYDRRGRGESGDTLPYALEREIEDLEALVEEAGGSASLYGISSGACLALEAAIRLQSKIERLALYEAPYASGPDTARDWRGYREQLDALLAEGRTGDAVALFMGFVGTPTEMIAGMRQAPMWTQLEAVARTLPYDAEAMGEDRSVPIGRAADVTAVALVMNGSESPPFMSEAAEALTLAIPGARHVTLEGQRHDVSPEALSPVLAEFFAV
jgi:pimeloyl-ACP methyl ester carboxylesterase